MILPLFAVAQTKKFQIDGKLAMPDNTVILLLYQGDTKYMIDSTKLRSGSFSFNGDFVDSRQATVVVKDREEQENNACSFFLTAGKINITGKKDLNTAIVKGGAVNTTYDAWKKQYGTELFTNDSNAIADFVLKNLSSPVSLDLVIQRGRNSDRYYSLFERLSPELKTFFRAKEYQLFVDRRRALKVGQFAPDFTVMDPDGKSWKLSDYKGHYVYLDFWASWCKPCRAAHPWLSGINNRFKEKGFVMLGISLDYKKEAWVKAINEDHVQWRQGSELKGFGGEIPKLYQIGVLPNGVLIDPDGRIIEKGNLEKTLEARLRN